MPPILLRTIILSLLGYTMMSCGALRQKSVHKDDSFKRNDTEQRETVEMPNKDDAKVMSIINTALEFRGTPYKYGGSTRKGIDCSGLLFTSFLAEGISLPRTSRSMSLEGKRLYLKEVIPGDLLFFETNKNRKVINHVGLVVEVDEKDIFFIHSSTSRGVIISSLSEMYWTENFVMARRIL